MVRQRPVVLGDWTDRPVQHGLWIPSVVGATALLGALLVGLQIWWILTPAAGVKSGPRVVEIPAHPRLREVAWRLEEAGVIRSPVGFMLLAIGHGSMRSLKAGEYQVPQGANTASVLSLLEQGQVVQHSVTFREGWTVAELARLLEI